MNDHDKSLWDRAKDALGMGNDDEAPDQAGIDMERPADDASPSADKPFGEVDGAAEAAAREGITGGMGASGGMGGAGVGSPAGVSGLEDDDATPATADAGDVLTEYEMGHEVHPDHERIADSGVSRDPSERVET